MGRVGLLGVRDVDCIVGSELLAALSSGARCLTSSFILCAWGCLFCPCRCLTVWFSLSRWFRSRSSLPCGPCCPRGFNLLAVRPRL